MSDLLDYAAETAIVHELKAEATTSLPEGWPENGIPPHPFAALNRLYDGDERQALRASLIANGSREKIVMYEDKILDGRNRYLECVAIGRFAANVDFRNHPDFVVFGGDRWDADRGTDPLAFVWDMDVRRHRSAKDTALAAARYLRFIAELKPEFPDATTAKLRLPTQAELAKRHGISERLVHSALMLLERAEPEVVKAVDEGKLSLTDAADVVSKLDKIEQRIIAENPDRKSTKRAVKAAKPKARKSAPPAPELPSPMSRQELATFAEEAVQLALAAFRRHGNKQGASISADAIIAMAVRHEIAERSGTGWGFTRPMLLALGQLREPAEPVSREARRKRRLSESMDDSKALSAEGVALGLISPEAHAETVRLADGIATKHGDGPVQDKLPATSAFQRELGFDQVGGYRQTPAGEPTVADLVKAGSVVHTNYGATRYIVVEVTAHEVELDGATYAEHSLHLCAVAAFEEKPKKATLSRGQAFINELVAVGGRLLKLFEANDDEVFIESFDARAASMLGQDTTGSGAGTAPAAGLRGEVVTPSTDGRLTGGETAQPRLAAYEAALAAGREHAGKHTIKTAEPILRAGVAADVARQKIADDTRIPLGSVSGWCGRLKLQRADRNPTVPRSERAAAL